LPAMAPCADGSIDLSREAVCSPRVLEVQCIRLTAATKPTEPTSSLEMLFTMLPISQGAPAEQARRRHACRYLLRRRCVDAWQRWAAVLRGASCIAARRRRLASDVRSRAGVTTRTRRLRPRNAHRIRGLPLACGVRRTNRGGAAVVAAGGPARIRWTYQGRSANIPQGSRQLWCSVTQAQARAGKIDKGAASSLQDKRWSGRHLPVI
jgi:hypothetical protein